MLGYKQIQEIRKIPELEMKRLEHLPRGEDHYLFGKHQPLETCEKISNSKKGKTKPNSGSFQKGIVPWHAGLKNPYSAKTIEKMRQAKLGTHPIVSQTEKERRSKRCIEYNMSEKSLLLSKKKVFNTKPEIEMKRCLKENGISYDFQYPVRNIEHCYIADFYLPLYNIILEVDGKGFHNYPDGRSIDHTRVQEMENVGYRVLRFWEGEFDAKSVWREI